MTSVELEVPEDYSLHQSVAFLSGFTPQPVVAAEGGPVELRFATPLAPSWEPVELTVTQPGTHLVVEWLGSGTPEEISRHVRRILSLDVDAAGFLDVVASDPVLAATIDPTTGFRPSLFWSPYEAAVWAVISQRIRMTQATTIKMRLAAQQGSTVGSLPATPSPDQLLALESFAGLNETKIARLHAVATAALEGTLDPSQLRALPPDASLDSLQLINGVGPFSAELILVRGAGAPDVFPSNERRLHTMMRTLYECPNATAAELSELADAWKPFRSWISFQLRRSVESPT